MQVGIIGLGKMGANIARRLMRGGHDVVAFDLSPDAVAELSEEGASGARDLADLAGQLATPRAIWIMVPAGAPVDGTLEKLRPHLAAGDVVVEGGNSDYRDSMRRAAALAPDGLHYVDCGTSGGVWGLAEGYSLMLGGTAEAVDHITPAIQTIAPAADKGWGHMGPSGAGHFVKMVHNGIEYALMQSYAEGFALMRSKEEFGLDMHQVATTWQHGSVVRSWLLDLAVNALADEPDLGHMAAYVPDSGMGRWTAREGIDQAVPLPAITAALQERFASRTEGSFAYKLLSALRNQFGGHAFKNAEGVMVVNDAPHADGVARGVTEG